MYGGSRLTQSHIVIAAFVSGNRQEITQLTGRQIIQPFINLSDKSEVWSRKAFDLVNIHRESLDLPLLQWHSTLHTLAFQQSTEMSNYEKYQVEFAPKDPADRRADIDERINRVDAIAEYVLRIRIEEPSDAVELAFAHWLEDREVRDSVEGDFTHFAVA